MLENNISEADRQFLNQWAHCGFYIAVWFTNYMLVHTNVVNCFTCWRFPSWLVSGFIRANIIICRHTPLSFIANWRLCKDKEFYLSMVRDRAGGQ